MAKEEFFEERFSVDTQGMRQLHGDRKPEHLVKELIQNVFDEDASTCCVTIKPAEGKTMITVEDDGPGFSNIRDAYTLMGETRKRMDPTCGAASTWGSKEVLSIAEWARIETPGSTVDFPVTGGRAVRKNRRKRGTRITALMPWNEEQAKPLEQRLRLIRPPDSIDYRVNGRRVIRKEPAAVRSAILDTVIQEAQGQPIRPARRHPHN